MKDTLKQLWMLTKYIFGFSKNFTQENVGNINLFRYEIEFTRQILILSTLEVLLFLIMISITMDLLNDYVMIAILVSFIEFGGCMFLLDRLIGIVKMRLQKKYNIHEED